MKQYLNRIKLLDTAIKDKLIEISELRRIVYSTTAVIKDDYCSSKGTSDKVGNIVAEIIDFEKSIEKQTEELVKLRKAVIQAMDGLDSLEYDIIYQHYFQYKDFIIIASDLGYSVAWINKKHRRALKFLEKSTTKYCDCI